MQDEPIGLRERTRRAVQREITDAANALFIEQGYEETTIDQIAAAVGMSQRSIFRYFSTKEDIVLGKFDFAIEEMIGILRERPEDEAVWVSLRRMFDPLVIHDKRQENHRVAEPIQRIVFETAPLFATYLQKLHQLQDGAVSIIMERAAAAGAPFADNDPAPRALVAAACGCLVAAQYAWLGSGAAGRFATAIDRAMATVAPAVALG